MNGEFFAKEHTHLKQQALIALVCVALCATLAICATGSEQTKRAMDRVAALLRPLETPATRGAETLRILRRWTAERRALLDELAELRDERRALRLFFGRRDAENLKMTARAQNRYPIVYRDPREWWEAARVSTGGENFPPGSPVLDGTDLVGVVTTSGAGAAWVRLITSSRFFAPVVVAQTREIGVLTGDDSGGVWLLYLPSDADSRAGMKILTALGSRLPAGITVGVVAEEKTQMLPGVDAYRVHPAADLFRLQYLYIAPGANPPTEAEAPSPANAPTGAEDITE